ncbi:MAG: cytochrome c oxidase assembly protein [Betaproteobacteria bacterium]|jgi:cytochrome c oxidase assembly protein subunit 11|nr:cytochrome c oxidase assembly protein [Pseudomonadota bacterium]NBO03503.1 cytochrome c oxidase assembly protein [Betaproteobacteria bacterium]HAB47101.1 cytochrome c oxidase assembly protein [Lautropia sp.]NBP34388.1 cytochrome c oxidase assembly protein [Betaproteobacteria bacterium]NBQ95149.1 cytochrome c oxidase assembly protein [Betaproteobacteria bacterium]
MQSDFRQINKTMLGKLLFASLLMFGFGFAMVPIYQKICEVTGVNVLTQRDERAEAFAKNTQVDTTRSITIEFDANAHGPWQFKPEVNAVSAHPGELVTVYYELRNRSDASVTGQAIPSYAPGHAANYFKKLECFCFKQQVLDAGETRKFPVIFVVDPQLPGDVSNITLSYTFFDIAGTAKTAASATKASARAGAADLPLSPPGTAAQARSLPGVSGLPNAVAPGSERQS